MTSERNPMKESVLFSFFGIRPAGPRALLFLTVTTLAACSCREAPVSGKDEHTRGIKALDEIPLEQLRVFLRGYVGDWRPDTDEAKGVPAPPVQKPYPEGAALVDLVKPEDIALGDVSLAKLINRRRSRRDYTETPLTNEELSFLLWSAQGISHAERDDTGKITRHLRTVPSGGARHPFETYLIINRVEGIEPGLYRFLPVEHKLLPIRPGKDVPQLLADACYGRKFAAEAAVAFVWSATPYRTEWSYGYIAHRMIAMDAGHACQNLYLSAEAIGAGACALLGYDQEKLDRLIGVDGKDEFAVYLATVGKINTE